MARNIHFSNGAVSEQNLYEDITIEALKIYGSDVFYLPRDVVNEDKIFGADIQSKYNSSWTIEMYIENTDGFDGEGDLFTKFGIEIRDQVTFIVSRKRWRQTVAKYDNEIQGDRPFEGDLIFLPMSGKMFQIMHVEHERPFYQLKNLPTYALRCELYEYSDEDFDTNRQDIDSIEKLGYQVNLSLGDSDGVYTVGETVTQLQGVGSITGEVTLWNDSDKILSVAHLGHDSDQYRMFRAGYPITGTINTDSRLVLTVEDDLGGADPQNQEFEDESLTFLDFSEINPFGEPPSN